MDSADQSKCACCGGKAAKLFIITIVSGEKASQCLCKDCYESALSGPAKQFMDDLKAGRCHCCGAHAVATDCLSGGLDTDPRYLCFSCSTESNKVAMEKVQALGDGIESLPASELHQQLREIAGQIEAHMHRWVVQRDN